MNRRDNLKKSQVDDLEKARAGKYADTPENRKLGRVGQQYGSEKKEEGNNIEIKVGQKYHSPAPKSGGEEIDFVIKNIENNKYTIETFNKEGRKGEHTFDETTIKELINESKLKK